MILLWLSHAGLAEPRPGRAAVMEGASWKEVREGQLLFQLDEPAAFARDYEPDSLLWITHRRNRRQVLVRVLPGDPQDGLDAELTPAAAGALNLQKAPADVVLQQAEIAVRAAPAGPDPPPEFAVAVASYPDLLRAAYRVLALQRAGVQGAVIQQITLPEATRYRVIVAGLPSPEAADTLARSLEARGLLE
jgi:hypothetical protein